MPDIARKMLIVNNACAYRHAGNIDKCNRILDAVDWTASSDNFRLCVAALKDDMGVLTTLMPSVASSEAITKISFRTWPVFKFAKERKEFQDAFFVAFGEPLLPGKSEPSNAGGEDDISDKVTH
jgi:hypothetical protein